ncbi:hypothetical protein ACIBCD_14755 [Nocardia brasiliensis]|uniref:hypothetical protein n=1 Tax=Nocardia brasiliensis TaxID=37326 RepID=UPI0037A83E22
MTEATPPLSEQHKLMLRLVIGALNSDPAVVSAADVHRHLAAAGTPADIEDIAAALEILRLPQVGYRRGIPADWVMDQIWNVLQGLGDDDPPEFIDDRY